MREVPVEKYVHLKFMEINEFKSVTRMTKRG